MRDDYHAKLRSVIRRESKYPLDEMLDGTLDFINQVRHLVGKDPIASIKRSGTGIRIMQCPVAKSIGEAHILERGIYHPMVLGFYGDSKFSVRFVSYQTRSDHNWKSDSYINNESPSVPLSEHANQFIRWFDVNMLPEYLGDPNGLT